jgi:molecular chaperone DnaK
MAPARNEPPPAAAPLQPHLPLTHGPAQPAQRPSLQQTQIDVQPPTPQFPVPALPAPVPDAAKPQLQPPSMPPMPMPGAQSSWPPPAVGTSIPLLIDVTPLTLAVETVGGYVDRVIARNTPVPCSQTRTFTTSLDNQQSVVIRVCQGEQESFPTNTALGQLELSGLRAARRGEVFIEVTFELDADGILQVRARDLETSRETAAQMRLIGIDPQQATQGLLPAII